MPFQIGSNYPALNVYNNLGVHQAKAADSLARISSGLKAAGAGDVASQGTVATLSANMAATQSNISQVQAAINQLQVADAAYGEMIALGNAGLALANTLGDAGVDVSAITAQLVTLTAGIASINTNTQFNGVAVLGTALAPNVGAGTTTVTPAAATPPTANTSSAYTTFLNGTVDLRSTNAGNLASLQNTLQVLNSVAATELAGVGQVQDTDIATEMMNLTSANILTAAATAMLAQAMQMPNSVLTLLK
mgnify:FL=1